jgi:Icc-related predicted phosphoesterase
MNSGGKQLKILAVSDEVDGRLYGNGSALLERAKPDLILACGDLPAYYLDYLVSQLNTPMYAIHGNHDTPPGTPGAEDFSRCGATWVGGRTVRTRDGLLIAGFDGCLRYNDGAYQQTQLQMQATVRCLAPWLWLNKLRFGRALDVLVTHAPPAGVHEGADASHRGFAAFRWLIETFRPRYHLHGHAHVYDRRTPTQTTLGTTEVVNVYPYRELSL